MSNIKKQKLLSESLQAMGVSDVVREDLENLITVLIEQEKKTKDAVIKELKELGQIVPETVIMEDLVDWLWKLLVDGRMMSYQQYTEAKKLPSTQNNKQDALQALRLKSKTSTPSVGDTSKASALNQPTQEPKKRPAIYDEIEQEKEEEKSKTETKKSIFDRIQKNPKSEEKKTLRSDAEAPAIIKRIKPSNKQTEKNAFASNQATTRHNLAVSKPTHESQAHTKNTTASQPTNTTETKREPPALKNRIVQQKNKPEVIEEEFAEEELQQDQNQEIQQSEPPMKIKKRCRNWPNCKLGDMCAFHHPTEPCKYFPKCSYGDECLCIHPAIPCKFGAFCTRPDCAYLHPNVAMTRRFPQQFGVHPMKAKPKPRQENNVAS